MAVTEPAGTPEPEPEIPEFDGPDPRRWPENERLAGLVADLHEVQEMRSLLSKGPAIEAPYEAAAEFLEQSEDHLKLEIAAELCKLYQLRIPHEQT